MFFVGFIDFCWYLSLGFISHGINEQT
jgi:hypothetical protein